MLDVPTSDPRIQAVLEASTDPARTLDDGDLDLLDAAAQLGGLVLEASRVKPPSPHRLRDGAAPLIGSSPGMEALRQRVERVATTDFTVLIEGESGTGKELVARQIHELSRRRRGPFVAVNCAAVVETLLEAELFGIEERTATGVRGRRGKFEHSDMGTLFLDEVSDLSLSAQAKLLRAVQDLAVERVGGTGTQAGEHAHRRRDQPSAVGHGRQGPVPRRPVLPARAASRSTCRRCGSGATTSSSWRATSSPATATSASCALSDGAQDALRLHGWPGNVRELERVIERAVALAESERIELDDLPPQVRGEYAEVLAPSLARTETMRAWGSRYARLVFERCGRQQAAGLPDARHQLSHAAGLSPLCHERCGLVR